MAKEIAGQIKLQIKGGAANPSPPVGPALGAKGINIMEFCKPTRVLTSSLRLLLLQFSCSLPPRLRAVQVSLTARRSLA